ncbi:hypothetical protein K1D81_22735, partial [Escherichia coli]|uniref:hypothetical protein n=1 Tax=Escherichia coli TaxID=562 RepID=UPI001C69100D
KRAYCLKTQPATGETYPKSDLFNKAPKKLNGNFIAITAGYKHNNIHCEVFLSDQLICFFAGCW